MACGYGACYGCAVELDGELEAPLRRRARAGRRVTPDPQRLRLPRRADRAGRRAHARRLRDEDRHAAGRARATRRCGSPRPSRDAQLDRAREPGTRAFLADDAAAAARARACRSGSRSAASRPPTTRRRARASTTRRRPRSSSTSRARTSTRRPSRRPRSSPPAASATGAAALREALAGRLGHRRGRARGRGSRRRRPLAREHDPRPRARRATLRPRLGRAAGGYSGPALKPIALAAVYACASARSSCRSWAWAASRPGATRSSSSPPARAQSRSERSSSPTPTRRSRMREELAAEPPRGLRSPSPHAVAHRARESSRSCRSDRKIPEIRQNSSA